METSLAVRTVTKKKKVLTSQLAAISEPPYAGRRGEGTEAWRKGYALGVGELF